MNPTILLLSGLLLALATDALAQEGLARQRTSSDRFTHFSERDGLPSDRVYGILEDVRGYIWVHTDAGIARFDGYDWRTVGREEGLACTDCWSMRDDGAGGLLVVGDATEVTRVDADTIRALRLRDLHLSDSIAPTFQAATTSSYPAGVTLLTEDSIHLYFPSRNASAVKTLGHRSLRYVAQMKAFYAFAFGASASPSQPFAELSTNRAETISENFFLITDGPLRGEYFYEAGLLRKCSAQGCSTLASDFKPSRRGLRWWASCSSPTLQLTGAEQWLELDSTGLMIDSIMLSEVPTESPISAVFKDRHGHLWISTLGDGVFLLGKAQRSMRLCQRADGSRVKVTAIATWRDTLRCATEGAGLFDLVDDELIASRLNPVELRDAPVTYFEATADGARLFASSFDGGFRFDAHGLTNVTTSIGLPAYRYNRTTRAIYHYTQNTLDGIRYGLITDAEGYQQWAVGNQVIIATPYCGGFKLDPSTSWRLAPPSPDAEVAIVYDEHQVYRCDNWSCEPLLQDSTLSISSVAPLGFATFLVATQTHGVIRLQAGNTRPSETWSKLNDVVALAVDSTAIWAATPRGLYLLDSRDGEVLAEWNSATGLPSDRCRDVTLVGDQVAVLSGKQVVLLPRRLPEPSTETLSAQALRVCGLTVNGQKMDTAPGTARLPAGSREVSLSLDAIRPGECGRIAYEVQVSPLDTAPRLQRARDVRLDRLSPGTYTLMATARSDAGERYALAAPFKLTLLPAFHQRTEVRLLGLGLLVLSLFGWARARERRRSAALLTEQTLLRRSSELQLEALRSQMNPHFIFNALGSIQYYIQEEAKQKADEYLGRFARLMRRYLDSSKHNNVTLADEYELLRQYIELEQIRFDDTFTYTLAVAPGTDASSAELPSMILQPFVENAILHGLSARTNGGGELYIQSEQLREGLLQVEVSDNGQGRANAAKRTRRGHRSRATQITAQRLEALRRSGFAEVNVVFADLYPEPEDFPGTRVTITIQLLDDA